MGLKLKAYIYEHFNLLVRKIKCKQFYLLNVKNCHHRTSLLELGINCLRKNVKKVFVEIGCKMQRRCVCYYYVGLGQAYFKAFKA